MHEHLLSLELMPPSRETPANICMYLVFLETTVILPLIVWVYLHLNFSGGLHETFFYFCKSDVSAIPRSSKVTDFGSNRKCVWTSY